MLAQSHTTASPTFYCVYHQGSVRGLTATHALSSLHREFVCNLTFIYAYMHARVRMRMCTGGCRNGEHRGVAARMSSLHNRPTIFCSRPCIAQASRTCYSNSFAMDRTAVLASTFSHTRSNFQTAQYRSDNVFRLGLVIMWCLD